MTWARSSVPRQPARAGAGGHHDTVGGDLGPVVELDPAALGIERHGPSADVDLHTEVVERVIVGQDRLARAATCPPDLLGKRWAVVGVVDLIAHKGEPAVKPPWRQLLDGTEAGQRAPDHRNGAVERTGARRSLIWRRWPATPGAERGRKTKLVRRVSPIDADGSAEYW